jgi:hypothetical protein
MGAEDWQLRQKRSRLGPKRFAAMRIKQVASQFRAYHIDIGGEALDEQEGDSAGPPAVHSDQGTTPKVPMETKLNMMGIDNEALTGHINFFFCTWGVPSMAVAPSQLKPRSISS